MTKKIIALLLAASMVFSMTACGGSQQSTTAAETTAAETTKAQEAESTAEAAMESLEAQGAFASEPKNGDHYVVGFSIMSVSIDYFAVMMKAMKEKCEAEGIELLFQDSNSDASVQHNQVMDFIANNVDAIILSVNDSNGIVAAVEEATNAGIPVFCIDTYANSDSVIEAVCTDNYGMGVEAAHQIAARLTERYGEPKGKVFDLIMSLKFSSGVAREEGFRDTIAAEYPNIEVVLTMDASTQTSTGIDAGMACTMDALQQLGEGELDAMWCHNDNNVIGAIRAMEQAGRLYDVDDPNHIIIYGVDGQKNVYDMIVAGQVDGMIMQQPGEMSRYIIDSVLKYLTTGERNTEVGDYVTSYPYQAITHWNYDTFDTLWFHELDS